MKKKSLSKAPKRRSDRLCPDENPNHKMGKRTGYSETDGLWMLAPSHTDAIDHLLDRGEAETKTFQKMIGVLQAAAVEREAATGAMVRSWWQRVADDLDLDLKVGWEYLPSIGAIRKRKEGPRTIASESGESNE